MRYPGQSSSNPPRRAGRRRGNPGLLGHARRTRRFECLLRSRLGLPVGRHGVRPGGGQRKIVQQCPESGNQGPCETESRSGGAEGSISGGSAQRKTVSPSWRRSDGCHQKTSTGQLEIPSHPSPRPPRTEDPSNLPRMWSRQESNLRPPQCHCGALPTELRPHALGRR